MTFPKTKPTPKKTCFLVDELPIEGEPETLEEQWGPDGGAQSPRHGDRPGWLFSHFLRRLSWFGTCNCPALAFQMLGLLVCPPYPNFKLCVLWAKLFLSSALCSVTKITKIIPSLPFWGWSNGVLSRGWHGLSVHLSIHPSPPPIIVTSGHATSNQLPAGVSELSQILSLASIVLVTPIVQYLLTDISLVGVSTATVCPGA